MIGCGLDNLTVLFVSHVYYMHRTFCVKDLPYSMFAIQRQHCL